MSIPTREETRAQDNVPMPHVGDLVRVNEVRYLRSAIEAVAVTGLTGRVVSRLLGDRMGIVVIVDATGDPHMEFITPASRDLLTVIPEPVPEPTA